MIFSDFRTQLRRALEESSAVVWSDDSLLYWTNEAMLDIARRAKQDRTEWYTECTALVSDYTLPTRTLEVLGITYDGDKMTRLSQEAMWDTDESFGSPTNYSLQDTTIRLWPTPDVDAGVLTIIRRSAPDELTADEDEMPWSSECNTLIEYFVLSRAFEQTNDWQTADAYKMRYENQLLSHEAQNSITESADGSPSYPVEAY